MGALVAPCGSSRAGFIALVIVALNVKLLVDFVGARRSATSVADAALALRARARPSMKLNSSKKATNGARALFFNLTRPVGKGYPNAAADDVAVRAVCVCGHCREQRGAGPPIFRRSGEAVQVTGTMDAAPQAGIDAWQPDRRVRFGHLFEADGIFSTLAAQDDVRQGHAVLRSPASTGSC